MTIVCVKEYDDIKIGEKLEVVLDYLYEDGDAQHYTVFWNGSQPLPTNYFLPLEDWREQQLNKVIND